MTELSPKSKNVHLISLGCARNRVDSEVMLGTLLNKGWAVSDDPSHSDAIVINTCGFIGPAKEESIDTILGAAEYKQQNPDQKLIVTGCLTQRYKQQLAKGLPEVDLFIGTDEFAKIDELIEKITTNPEDKIHVKRTHYLYSEELPRINTLNKASAYVKVAEGCQHNCAFCIIPAIRGRLRSRPIMSVVREVEHLVENGVKEVNLIAQDLAAYGRDRDTNELLPLLKELAKIEKLQWIRLLYVYPENIDDEFIAFFKSEDKLVKYLDIPVQHASNRVLKSMNRDVSKEQMKATITKLRHEIPDMAIRTSVMAGFPGETDADFNELKEFVAEMKFDHLGCFVYSKEENTVAGRMSEQVDDDVKHQRQQEIMAIQQSISRQRLKSYLNQEVDVLIEGLSEETDLLYKGRISTQAPEVDGVILINDGQPKVGEIVKVKISEAHDYDLVGHCV